MPFVIRAARPDDHAMIVDFNARLAWETENKTLDPRVLSVGVEQALADPDRLRYWVAEETSDGAVAGQAAVTREWSDWRNGWLWWFQSVFVRPESRGQGIFRSLYHHIRSAALDAGDVIGLRLYVERENQRAQQAYQALGMKPGGYHVYEEIWSERWANPAETHGERSGTPLPRGSESVSSIDPPAVDARRP